MERLNGLYTATEVKQLEQLYARFHDDNTYTLMERAGKIIFKEIRRRWRAAAKLLIVCGSGNNGGDGLIVARLAAQTGMQFTLALTGEKPTKGDAKQAWDKLIAANIPVQQWQYSLLDDHDVIVDAMLGTGFSGELREPIANIIASINRSRLPVIAVDLPSGLDANTGAVNTTAIDATVTITFIGYKKGLVTGAGPSYCGELLVNDLECGKGVFALVRANTFRYQYRDGVRLLKPRDRVAHKGHFGHTLVVGGAPGFAGAARLASEAAARIGSGLVSLLTHQSHASVATLQCPEVMAHGIGEKSSKQGLHSVLSGCNSLLIGPGLSQLDWGKNLLATIDDYLVQENEKNRVVSVWDADALNLLAKHPTIDQNRILTPHPGEAARLLGISTKEVEKDRFAAADTLVTRYGGVIVLKGAGTIVATKSQMCVVSTGNPGMASGGMGDVLGGIIAGLLAQGIGLYDSARLGVAIHGEAGNLATQSDSSEGPALERGLLAHDLFPFIRQLANPAV